MRKAKVLSGVLLAGLLAGCGGAVTPVDVNGTYSINTLNGPNGCEIANYTVGDTGSTTAVIAQNLQMTPGQFTIQFQNLGLNTILLLLGFPTTIVGTVSGNRIEATINGRATTKDACSATPQIRLSAVLNGNSLENGLLIWSYLTNNNAACGVWNACETRYSFNGIRPP